MRLKERFSYINLALCRPLSPLIEVAGWLLASLTYFVATWTLGGPVEGDLAVSAYSTWLIEHGELACSYASGGTFHYPSIASPFTHVAPIYPLFAGLLAALFHVGVVAKFPSASAFGHHCSSAYLAVYHWSIHANAAQTTALLGYASWPFFIAGLWSFLRTTKLARTTWQVVALCVVGLFPVSWETITQYFHPLDQLALGLALASLAAARTNRYVWSGVAIAFGVATNQFDLLVAVLLFTIISPSVRWRFSVAAAATWGAIVAPLVLLTHGQILSSLFIGSGNILSLGGTWIYGLKLHGTVLTALSRGLPLVCVLALGVWGVRRYGVPLRNERVLAGLFTLTMICRLVFEVNFWGYYLFATATGLLLLVAITGRLRSYFVVWLMGTMLFTNPIPWAFASNGLHLRDGTQIHVDLVPALVGVAVVAAIIAAIRRHVRYDLYAFILLGYEQFHRLPFQHGKHWAHVPRWGWQVLLVGTAIALTIRLMHSTGPKEIPNYPENEMVDAPSTSSPVM